MQIRIDFRSGVPIYAQIIDQIKQLIANNEIRPGDQLPTVRQLAQELRVNFNTIARAYRLLDEEGIISTQHGRGTYVLEPASRESLEHLRYEVLNELTHHYVNEGLRLGFSFEEIGRNFNHIIEDFRKRESQ